MEGAIAALREVHPEPQVALVVNELTAESRAALIDGYAVMAIATPLAELCQTLIDLMVRSRSNGAEGASTQHFLDPKLVLPEIL